jgi:protein gp37
VAETDIEWTHMPGYRGAVWNVFRGCARVSAGCGDGAGGGCYAERTAGRFSGPGMPYEGLVRLTGKGPRWTGDVRFVAEKLAEPLRTKAPTCWFVNSMSDVFHEGFTDLQIAALFGVMAATPRHRYLVLTKRPERMRAWFAWLLEQDGNPVRSCVLAAREHGRDIGWPLVGGHPLFWPLPNVDLLVSVEDQKSAEARIPLLLQTPAVRRGVSYEPALGPVDFDVLRVASGETMSAFAQTNEESGLDWIIVGGESGPSARPFDLAWARSVVEEGHAAGVPVFVKQMGARPYDSDGFVGVYAPEDKRTPRTAAGTPAGNLVLLRDRKGGDMQEWPPELRVRQFPEVRRGA